MEIEYEATFPNIDKDDARNRLGKVNATLIRSEFLQKRVVFDLPKEHKIRGGFVRVRDEGDKITLTLKIVDGDTIADQRETMVAVSDFDATVALITAIGCIPRAYEESKRELWKIDDVEITIDEWPFLGSLVEIEGKSEADVKAVAAKLGFDWSDARFCAIGTLYVKKYGSGPADVARKTGKMTNLTFDGRNPFIKD